MSCGLTRIQCAEQAGDYLDIEVTGLPDSVADITAHSYDRRSVVVLDHEGAVRALDALAAAIDAYEEGKPSAPARTGWEWIDGREDIR